MLMEKIIDKYRYCMKDEIGKGVYGVVYKGRHVDTKEPVAIKAIEKKNLKKSPY